MYLRVISVKPYGGATSDTTYESEFEWSSVSCGEHEVPDIETPESPGVVNEYTMAEIEGAYRLKGSENYEQQATSAAIDIHTSHPSTTQAPDYTNAREQSTTRIALNRSIQEHQSLVERNRQRPEWKEQQCFLPSSTLVQKFPRRHETLERQNSVHDIVSRCESPSPRISRSRVPSIGGQAMYKPGFFDEINYQTRPTSSSGKDVGSMRCGLWTHFTADLQSRGTKSVREKEMSGVISERLPDQYGYRGQRTESFPNSEILLNHRKSNRSQFTPHLPPETPRMHQPYTQPNPGFRQNPLCQVYKGQEKWNCTVSYRHIAKYKYCVQI